MTAINFPDTPEVGQAFTAGLVTWVWNGSVWNGTSVLAVEGVDGVDGVDGENDFHPFLIG